MKLSVNLFVCEGDWNVFGPVTNGNFFLLEPLNVEEMAFAAVNRRSDSHILKRRSIGKPALSLWPVVVPVNVLNQFLSRQNPPPGFCNHV